MVDEPTGWQPGFMIEGDKVVWEHSIFSSFTYQKIFLDPKESMEMAIWLCGQLNIVHTLESYVGAKKG